MEEKEKKYIEATGRRKTSVARVRLYLDDQNYYLVNQKPMEVYFPTLELQKIAKEALEIAKVQGKFGISVKVKGGGIHSQAEAVRHGLARALVLYDPNLKKELKEAGFLKRDERMRERKKFGLKRARRAPQWQKR